MYMSLHIFCTFIAHPYTEFEKDGTWSWTDGGPLELERSGNFRVESGPRQISDLNHSSEPLSASTHSKVAENFAGNERQFMLWRFMQTIFFCLGCRGSGNALGMSQLSNRETAVVLIIAMLVLPPL